MARLILEAGGERREYNVAGVLVIGRSRSNPVFIDDRLLSREHTRVFRDGDRYFVADQESKNGTFLNETLLSQAEVLKHGDTIRLMRYLFRFELEPGDPGAPAAPVALAARPVVAPAPLRALTPHPAAPVEAPSAILSILLWLVLIPVFGIAAFLFKKGFALILDRIPR